MILIAPYLQKAKERTLDMIFWPGNSLFLLFALARLSPKQGIHSEGTSSNILYGGKLVATFGTRY